MKNSQYEYITADSLIETIRAYQITNSESIQFNKYGNAIKSVHWYRIIGQADTRNTINYIYNSNNQLISKEERITHGSNEDSKLTELKQFTYDKNKKLTNTCDNKYYDTDTIENCSNISYEGIDILINGQERNITSGDTIEKYNSILSSNGKIIPITSKTRRELNNKGEVLRTITTDKYLRKERFSEFYSYDENGNLIQEIRLNREGEISSSLNYTYTNDKISVISEIEINGWNTKIYNNHGSLQRSQKFSQYDTILNLDEIDYQYDNNGNLVKKISMFSNGVNDKNITIYKNKYDYDRFNNWIEKRNFENDSLVYIERREILYY